MTVSYCPTQEILADFFTKPLQGALFNCFRRVLMGYDHINSLRNNDKKRSKLKECVVISNESLGKNASLDLSNDEKKDNEKRSVIVEDNPLSLNDVGERKGDMDFEMAGESRIPSLQNDKEDANQGNKQIVNIEKE